MEQYNAFTWSRKIVRGQPILAIPERKHELS